VYSISFFVNDIIENLEPLAYINGTKVEINSDISEGDNVNIIFPKTLGDYKKYFLDKEENKFVYYLNGEKLNENYIINEDDRIYGITENSMDEKKSVKVDEENSGLKEVSLGKEDRSVEMGKDKNDAKDVNNHEITVVANGKNVVLKGKKDYIFVDIFNHIEFDLTKVKGRLYLHLNGNNASYYDALSEGDIIEIGWE
jgi:hypothetical protein